MHTGVEDGGAAGDGGTAGDGGADGAQAPGAFRRTLVRVMTMQVASLLLLWLMQSWFGR